MAGKEPLFDDQSTFFTLDKDHIKLKELLSKTTSSNKNEFLKNGSKCNNVVGNSELETELENYSTAIINNSFIENNIDALNINSHSELEDPLNFDNLHSSVYNSLNDSVVIEITNEDLNQINDENDEESISEERQNFFLNRKRESEDSVESKNKYKRKDNGKKSVARLFWNHYVRNLLEKNKNEYGCIFFLDYFPEKFILSSYTKKNKHYFNYTLEVLLEDENLYKGLDPLNYYSTNKKVIQDLKKKGCKNIFEKTYRNLFKDFLHSEEYKKYYEYLLKNKGELEAEKFKYCAKKFI